MAKKQEWEKPIFVLIIGPCPICGMLDWEDNWEDCFDGITIDKKAHED